MSLNRTLHVEQKNLPEAVRNALAFVNCCTKDVAVTSKTETSIQAMGGAGYQHFVILVDLASGTFKVHSGSWGGANMFSPTNAVDLDDKIKNLVPNCAVIKGYRGGTANVVRCTVEMHPSNFAPLLPATVALSDRERTILRVYKELKGGSYRQEELRRLGATGAEIDALVSSGYLSRAKNGATQITTSGKNALRDAGLA